VFRTLYSKLSIALLLLFCVMGALIAYVLNIMFEPGHTGATITKVAAGAVVFALLAGLIVFSMLTRRLRRLADAVEAFRNSNFSGSISVPSSNPNGDEIDRLGYAFEQMEKRIVDQVQRLQTIDVQRRELLANVSHDLRTPLASMRGYLETLLLKEGSITPEEQRNYLEVAAKQSERLGKLVSHLFELTKLDAHEVSLNLETFPIAELLQDVAQKFQLAGNQKNVRIETDLGDLMPSVRADISLIERVMDNLIENALRHCTGGAVIRLGLALGDRAVTISVSDTGSGIAADDLGKVFDRFYQGNRNHGSGGGGAGLGLAITKRIVDLHGSEIHVESSLGQGTRFYFQLPVA
jgi:signal transduction histidine kinase